MKNRVDIKGDVAHIFVKRRDGTEFQTMVDVWQLPKLDEISTVYVVYDAANSRFYAHYQRPIKKGKYEKGTLHRLLTNAEPGLEVDHINHDTLDNRLSNLRVCSKSENQQNRIGAARYNTSSGIRGVSWNKSSAKWVAHMRINGKRITLGFFKDIREAEQTVTEARKKYMPFSNERMGVND